MFVLLERGRDGGWWSWVVFECPCVSVVSESFLMHKQHTRYTQSTPSHSLMLAVLLASPASSAGVAVHEAEIEGTGSQSPMCFPVAMVNALATHTEPSAKLITAHKAHHCDGHAPTQPRDCY